MPDNFEKGNLTIKTDTTKTNEHANADQYECRKNHFCKTFSVTLANLSNAVLSFQTRLFKKKNLTIDK